MSRLPPLGVSDFTSFFKAVHGHEPFPWQTRLATTVASTGWPPLLDLPTGSGKTAVLDIGVFVLALSAERSDRTVPRRIVYVVDRRTIVSQAHDRSRRIDAAIAEASEGVLLSVRERLSTLSGSGHPLRTVELRGGIARDDAWARTPDQPLIVVSTVDQVGSRLLFRGYGVTDGMKPVHAGLLGNDVLYLLDEVHLSQPFRETLSAVATRFRAWAETPVASPFAVVEMSATPGVATQTPFSLDEADRQHPVLSQRLRASKPVSLIAAKPRKLVEELASEAIKLLDRPGATVGVVVNRVKTARQIFGLLSLVDGVDAHLITGRMRPYDRDLLDQSLLRRIRAGRIRSVLEKPVVVVATQTIEAGADFDFDGVVSECASLDAVRQRFGRLDRLGELHGAARGAVVAPSDVLQDDAVYGAAIGKTWNWLNSVAVDGVVDFGLELLSVPPDESLLAPRRHAPVLLPAHLDAWVQTSPMPMPDPDIALWLHGPDRGAPDMQVIWRADLTEGVLHKAVSDESTRELACGMVEALPPVSAEAMAVPFLAVKRWLEGRSEPDFADVEGAPDESEDRRSEDLGEPKPVLVWRGDQSTVVLPAALRPGQTIVVPAEYGGIAAHNWDPSASAPVADVAEVSAFASRQRPVLRLHPRVIEGMFQAVAPVPPDSEGDEDVDILDGIRQWLTSLDDSQVSEAARRLVAALRSAPRRTMKKAEVLDPADSKRYLVVSGQRPSSPRDAATDDRVFTDGMQSSFTGIEVGLREHQDAVATLAVAYAARAGLGDAVSQVMTLCGQWHDAGKADPRFQRWLHGGSEFKALVQTAPIAKGAIPLVGPRAMREARERAGYPAGGRHELMSVALLDAAGAVDASLGVDLSLARHLIASHHGYCRPFAPWVPDPTPIDVSYELEGARVTASSAHHLERLDSGIAERFWLVVRQYGWWGAAYLETILRLADQQQSAREQRGR